MKGTKILLATDLSDNAIPAARWAHDFGRRTGLPVALIHVLDLSQGSHGEAYGVLEAPNLRQAVCDRMAHWYEHHTGARPNATLLEMGSPFLELSEAFRREDATVLVVSLSGKGAWDRLVFGSTALKLSQEPPGPLVIVHPDHATLGEELRMAMATDLTDNSLQAMRLAGEWSRHFGVRLDVVHASVLPSSSVITETELPEPLQSTHVIQWASDALDRLVHENAEALQGVTIGCHVLTDAPTRAVLEFVDRHKLDLLVLGQATKTGLLSRFSSVAIKMVQNMRCTTVIVPPECSR